MTAELDMLRKKVKEYDDMFNSKDPAYASLLLRRVVQLVQADNHMVWKLLQENLGREWFYRPVLDRSLNYKYHIDYEALDSVLGDLCTVVLGNEPRDYTKIASNNDCLLLGYMAQAFSQQKKYYTKELLRKDDNWEIKILEKQPVSGKESVAAEEQIHSSHNDRRQSVKSNALGGEFNLSNEAHEGNSYRDGGHPLQGTVKMLVNEIRNLRTEKHSISNSYEVLKTEFQVLEKYLQELTEAAGVAKEGTTMVQMLGKVRKLDQQVLVKNNFAKVLSQGKTETIARMVALVRFVH